MRHPTDGMDDGAASPEEADGSGSDKKNEQAQEPREDQALQKFPRTVDKEEKFDRSTKSEVSRTEQNWDRDNNRTAENQLSRPTNDVYGELLRIFYYLNEVLIFPIFGVRLPEPMLTLARSRRFKAAFLLRLWSQKRQDGTYAHEIVFNAYFFRSTQEVMQAMAHEMLHLGQAVDKDTFGEPGENGYHTEDWAIRMLNIGLRPVSADNPNIMTGQRVSDIVLDGGPFQIACEHYMKMGGSMLWTPVEEEELAANGGGGISPEQLAARKKKALAKKLSKSEFHCPKCPQQFWGNWKLVVNCGLCGVPMERDKSKDEPTSP